MGCPLPPYIKEGGRRWLAKERRAKRGSPTPTRLLPFLVGVGEGGRKGRGGEGKRGPAPLALNQFGLGLGGRPTLPLLPSISTKAHVGPLSPRGVPVTPRYSGICPKPSETLPISEHSRPIYRFLCLGYFETPCYVPDLIRDSELFRYINIHKLIIKLSSNVKRADPTGSRTI